MIPPVSPKRCGEIFQADNQPTDKELYVLLVAPPPGCEILSARFPASKDLPHIEIRARFNGRERTFMSLMRATARRKYLRTGKINLGYGYFRFPRSGGRQLRRSKNRRTKAGQSLIEPASLFFMRLIRHIGHINDVSAFAKAMADTIGPVGLIGRIRPIGLMGQIIQKKKMPLLDLDPRLMGRKPVGVGCGVAASRKKYA